MRICHRDRADLHRRKPKRQSARVMFQKSAHKSLDTSKDRSVQHYRPMFLPVSACVFQIKPFRQREIALDRTALPGAPKRVLYIDVDLGPVESPFAFANLILDLFGLESPFERFRGLLPILVRADRLFRARADFYFPLFKSESIK